MAKLPDRLHRLADKLNLDPSGFEDNDKPIDWDEVFGWMRFHLDEDRSEAIREIEEHYQALEAELDDLEVDLLEDSDTTGEAS
jgi:hypothetical protein